MAIDDDLAVERQALQLALRQREHATRWAQYLAHVLSAVYHEPGSVTQGGILRAVAAATEAGFEPITHEEPVALASSPGREGRDGGPDES